MRLEVREINMPLAGSAKTGFPHKAGENREGGGEQPLGMDQARAEDSTLSHANHLIVTPASSNSVKALLKSSPHFGSERSGFCATSIRMPD